MTSEDWMKIAIDLAYQAETGDEVPVGAILVHEGKILGRGFNQREARASAAAHAEIIALEDYGRAFSEWRVPRGTSLYVTAEPCLMCAGALLWARVSHIIYGCRDTKNAGLERIKPLIIEGVFDHRFEVIVGGVCASQCAGLMSAFFQKKRGLGEKIDQGNRSEVR